MASSRIRDLIIVIAALLLLVALSQLRASQNAGAASVPSTYDTGTSGYAALYDLLAREGMRVERFELPLGELTHNRSTLVIAGDGALSQAAPSRSALRALDGWVRGGGHLVLLDAAPPTVARDQLQLPAGRTIAARRGAVSGCAFAPELRGAAVAGTFTTVYSRECTPRRATVLHTGDAAAGMTYRHGSGRITIISTAGIFDNMHIAQKANARVAYGLFGPGTVLFDERVHGYAAGRSFWQVLPLPVRVALGIALAATLLAIAGANLPFAPPYEIHAAQERDSGAYIDSLARMLERGGAAHEALARIAARCEPVLGPRAAGDERARMLLRELRTLQSTPRPTPHDVLQAGRIFNRVQKDYRC
jgi:hypothetical protein